MTTPVPLMERVNDLIMRAKAQVNGALFNGMPRMADEPRDIAAALTHYAALRAALDVEALKAGADALADVIQWSVFPDDRERLVTALRHLIQIQEGA